MHYTEVLCDRNRCCFQKWDGYVSNLNTEFSFTLLQMSLRVKGNGQNTALCGSGESALVF